MRAARATIEGYDSRRHILNCAASVFKEKGYAAASLRDIARAAGMQTPSMYHHFASKDEIVAEVLDIAVDTVFREVRKSIAELDDPSPLQRIRAATAGHLRAVFETDDYNYASIRIFGQLPPHIGEITRERREEYVSYWKGLFEDAREKGLMKDIDTTIIRLFLFGAMNWAPQWYTKGRYSLTELSDILCDILFFGAAKTPEQPAAPTKQRT